MNARQKKKLKKRCYVWKYRHFKLAVKRTYRIIEIVHAHNIRLTDDMRLRIWDTVLEDIKHPGYLSYKHLKFARHLPKVDPNAEPPKLPPIVATEPVTCEYAPVTSSSCEAMCMEVD